MIDGMESVRDQIRGQDPKVCSIASHRIALQCIYLRLNECFFYMVCSGVCPRGEVAWTAALAMYLMAHAYTSVVW